MKLLLLLGLLSVWFDSCVVFCGDVSVLDESVLYNINFITDEDAKSEIENSKNAIVMSFDEERYKCIVPHELDSYDGPTPLELISPLFTLPNCSTHYGLWTIEVCHGRYVRQFRENREGKTMNVKELMLGRWGKNQYDVLLQQLRNSKTDKAPIKDVDGAKVPYFEIVMGNGTPCQFFNNKRRESKIFYICYVHGANQIHWLREISTCVYEIVILTPLLCVHPKYKTQKTNKQTMNCITFDGAVSESGEILELKPERHFNCKAKKQQQSRIELEKDKNLRAGEYTRPAKNTTNVSLVENFLAGKKCLNGVTGWWNYQFCYGKSAEQYHVYKNGSRISINMGIFDKKTHLQWLSLHPRRKPKPPGQRAHMYHFYSKGDICEKTAKPRQTQVRLKCLQDPNSNAVSFHMLEPKYCEYILGVESPLICKILDLADEGGLVKNANDGEDAKIHKSFNVVSM